MKLSVLLVAAFAATAFSSPEDFHKPMVSEKVLPPLIKIEDLMKGARQLQTFADASPQKNRVFGSPGHNATINYLLKELSTMSKYYDVEVQNYTYPWDHTTIALTNLTTKGTLVDIGFGCNATDYPPSINGSFAVVKTNHHRCRFGEQISLAQKLGAVGVIAFSDNKNNRAANFRSRKSTPDLTIPYALLDGSDTLKVNNTLALQPNASLSFQIVTGSSETFNVIATTKLGNQSNVIVVGAHSDSVFAGPGIEDDGSGSIGILTVAKALSHFTVAHAVRFIWFTAEEAGLFGSKSYVKHLDDAQCQAIDLYLNFDMIASPNYMYAIVSGRHDDDDDENDSDKEEYFWEMMGDIQLTFEDFFDEVGLKFTSDPIMPNTDHWPFFDDHIPVGGLFTGADTLKTAKHVELFGGKAGIAYDACYHKACDNVTNLSQEAFEVSARGIAFAVGRYAAGKYEYNSDMPGDPDAAV